MNMNDIFERNNPPIYKKGLEITLLKEYNRMDGQAGDKFIVESCIVESSYVVVSNGEYYPLEYFEEFYNNMELKDLITKLD